MTSLNLLSSLIMHIQMISYLHGSEATYIMRKYIIMLIERNKQYYVEWSGLASFRCETSQNESHTQLSKICGFLTALAITIIFSMNLMIHVQT